LEVLEKAPPVFMTPCKKRVLKVKEKLDDSFLRRSKRLSEKFQGYKDAQSARKGKKAIDDIAEEVEAVEEADEPMPLAVIPPP